VTLPVTVEREVANDYARLPSEALRDEAIAHVLALGDHPYRGLPLRKTPHLGDLSDCRKILFGGTAFRIVYRLIPNEKEPKKVKVIVIARRAGNHVYLEALRRLGRERFANPS
jgi:hypothetical protein